jgi:UDP-glucose 4-epimerase
VIGRFIARALHGRPPVIFGDGEQTRDFIHVHDTVRGLLRIAEESACVGGTFNLGRGTETSVNELARVILELTGRTDLQPIYQPARPGDVRRLCADTSKVRTMLGLFPLVSFRQGLVELIDWIQAQGDRLPDCEEEEPNRKRVAA